MKKKLSLIGAALVAANLSAVWSPIGFEIMTGVDDSTLGFPQPDDSVYGLNLALGAKLDNMYGLSVAGFGLRTGDVAGIEVSGLFNVSDSADEGALMVAGLFNVLKDSGQGMQISGIANVAENFAWLQVALVNVAEDSFAGQIGAFNFSQKSSGGAQIGAVNVSGLSLGSYGGVQIGAINVSSDFKGVQIGAINVASDFGGVQIGAINTVHGDFSGIQIGVLNFVSDSNVAMLPILRAAF